MKQNIRSGLSVLLLGMLACQPVIAVGWRELLLVVVLAAILIGPAVYRLIRTLELKLRQTDKDKTNNSK